MSDVAHGGVFVARHEGRVVFVSDAVDGERVRVRLSDTSKSAFWRGEVVEVVDASPHRRAHVWQAADVSMPPEDRPGGADLGHIALPHQRALKKRVLDDALARFGGIADPDTHISAAGPASDPAAIETPDALRWRTRVSLHVDQEGRVGPMAARSHRVIPASELPLATEAIERTARELGRAAQDLGAAGGRIDLVQPADGQVRMIVRPPAAPCLSSGARVAKSRRPARRAPSPLPPAAQESVTEYVGEREFRLDAGGFWQVHRLAALTLSDAVRAALRAAGGVDPGAQHLDLYGGVGLFAAVLGEEGGHASRVTSVESDARATEHAGENLSEWIGARAETARTDRFLARMIAEASASERARVAAGVTLLDPPRSGAGRQVVEQIASLSPASVVYVACDPVALSRDIGTFRQHGYELRNVEAFDLFPHSHHVEAVALLQRASTQG